MRTFIIAATFTFFVMLVSSGVAQEFQAFVPGEPIVEGARIYQAPPNEGALQAAARQGNVLEAINPFAPARYLSNGKFVASEVGDPFKNPNMSLTYPYGVVLLSFEY